MRRIDWKRKRRWEDRMTILWLALSAVLLVIVLIIIIDPQLLRMAFAYPRAPTG